MFYDSFIAPQAAVSKEQRKVLDAKYGDRVLAVVTVKDQLTGYKSTPILRSAIPGRIKHGDLVENAHFVDEFEGFHLGGVRIDQFIEEGRTLEDALFTLWVGYPPSTEEERIGIRDLLRDERNRFLQSDQWQKSLNYLASLCGDGSDEVDLMHVLTGLLVFLARFSKVGALIDADAVESITLADRFHEWVFIQSAMGVLIPAAFRRLYNYGPAIVPASDRGYSEAFAEALGVADSEERLSELGSVMDMLFILMLYHGPGNGSTLSGLVANSFNATMTESMCSMMGALLGPNHGKAATMGIRYLFALREEVGDDWTTGLLDAYARARVLEQPKKPAWCVGHALLKLPKGVDPETSLGDPRTAALVRFLEARHADKPFYRLARAWYSVVSPIVGNDIGAAFPKANVDAYSGLVLALEGVIKDATQASLIGGIFGVSRIAGACAENFYQVAATSGKPRPIRPGNVRDEFIPRLPKKG